MSAPTGPRYSQAGLAALAYGPVGAEYGVRRLGAYLGAYGERYGTYPEQLTEYQPQDQQEADA